MTDRQPPFQWRDGTGLHTLMVTTSRVIVSVPLESPLRACQADIIQALRAAPLQVREDIVKAVALPLIERLIRDADELERALKFRRETSEQNWKLYQAAKAEIEVLEQMCEDRRNRAKAAELENDRLRKLLEARGQEI